MTGENEHGEHRETSAEVYGGSVAAASAGAGADDSPYFTFQVAEGGTSFYARHSSQRAGPMNTPLIGTMTWATTPGQPMTLVEWQALSHLWNYVPSPVEHAGIEVGEVVAWRCWRLSRRAGLLTSMSAQSMWIPGEPTLGDADETGHGCTGVHAFKRATDAMQEYGAYGTGFTPHVVGRVLLWGEIVEHENGYRAEFGLPLSLEHIVPSRWLTRRWLRRLKAAYDRPDLLPRTTPRCTARTDIPNGASE